MRATPEDAFSSAAQPTPLPRGGWDAEERRLELQRDTERARARRAKWLAVAVVALLAGVGWWTRWDVVPQANGGQWQGMVFALDRLTGQIYLMSADELSPLKTTK